ncbi:MAG: response regulator transcription factor [Chloroflexi bacterium]|nr:response regulator transcription factor [Chloroflexota bacterium]
MNKLVRLMLVDDHEVVRQGLLSLFEGYPDLEIVAEASDGLDAIEKAINIKPDVILMDVSMPDMDGFEATRIISKRCKTCRVLALTVHEDREFMLEMIESGAWGFVTKRSLADDVVNAIHIVAAGGQFLSPEYTRFLVEDFRKLSVGENIERIDGRIPEDQKFYNVLSDREIQVIKLVADGLTSEEVGENLGITSKTVSRHRARIMDKLEINSTVDLVKFAIRNRFTDLY